MKKHFLLLMMAFLSITAWAQTDISGEEFDFSIKSLTYPYNPLGVDVQEELTVQGVQDPLDKDVNYQLSFFINNAWTTEAVPVNVGTYKVKAVGINDFSGETAPQSFSIVKADMTPNTQFVAPTLTAGLTYSGEAKNLIVAGSIKEGYEDQAEVQYALGDGAFSTTVPQGTNAGSYVVRWKVVGGTNYNDYYPLTEGNPDNVLNPTIAKAALPGGYTATLTIGETAIADFTPAIKTDTYNGAAQAINNAIVTVKNGDDVVETYAPVIKYYPNNERVATEVLAPADVKNANTYYLTIEAAESANYVYSQNATYVISPAPVTVMAIAKTKVYDGDPFANTGEEKKLTDAQFNITGLQAGEVLNDLKAVPVTPEAFAATAGDYNIKVVTTGAHIGEAGNTDNYDITVIPTVWKINKRPVSVSISEYTLTKSAYESWPAFTGDVNVLNPAVEATVGKGYIVTSVGADGIAGTGDDEWETAGTAGAINPTEEAAILGGLQLRWASEAEEILNGVAYGELEVNADGYPGAIIGSYTAENFPNYTITVTPGNLKIAGADFTVMPVVQSQIEYGDEYTIDYYAYNDGGLAAIDKDQLKFKVEGVDVDFSQEYSYAYDATTGIVATIEGLPEGLGTYKVSIVENTAVGTGENANSTANPVATQFTIGPKKLWVTVTDQTVHANDLATIIQDKGSVTFTEGHAPVAKDLETIEAALIYSLTENVIVDETTNKITGYKEGVVPVEGFADDCITVALDPDAAITNYVILASKLATGKLNISDVYDMDLAAEDAEAKIAEALDNGGNYNVTITGRTLKANTWNVMVLPFKVKTLDFCNAISGYAIFNRLKDVEGDDVKFGIVLDEIPANEPFIVKPLNDVNFDAMEQVPGANPGEFVDGENKAIVFRSVKFEEYEGENPILTLDGAQFIGTYKAAIDLPAGSYGMQGGSFKHFTNAKTNAVKFTRAYITLASGSASARFFVEEPNGETTAIKALNAETMQSIDAEGIYTIGGVKLQGVPTQKGVYIQKGKKVIIK